MRELLVLFVAGQPVVVACGNEARDACHLAGVAAIEICHPGMQALNRLPNRRPEHLAGLREAVRRMKLTS